MMIKKRGLKYFFEKHLMRHQQTALVKIENKKYNKLGHHVKQNKR